MIRLELPLRLVSEANARVHWSVRHRRLSEHRRIAALALRRHVEMLPSGQPLRITLTRIGARRLDSDNLAGACKGIRDGVADALGIDDGDERLEWVYAQAQVPKKYAVAIRIEVRR